MRTSSVTRPSRATQARRHPWAFVVLIGLALVMVGGLYTVLGSASAAQADATNPDTIQQGHALFLEGCSSCHGLNAQGVNGRGPSLIGVGAADVDFQVGTGRMPAATYNVPQVERRTVQYSQAEIDAMAAYVASLAPGPSVPSFSDLDLTGANLQAGGELFRTNCAQCHNFAGEGGALTLGKYAPSLTGSTPRHIWEAMLVGPQSMPKFPNTTITPLQKRDIIFYLTTVRAQPNPGGLSLGRVGPVSEGLFLWVVGLGVVIAVAVWIGAKSS